MTFSIVIPARYASSRLPGKPLADIAGLPMIIRVMQRCMQSAAQEVLVATDDIRVAEVVREYGGEVCMTRADHASGTDRLQEVAEARLLPEHAIIVNVQGDEPLIPPAVINQVATNLATHDDCAIATLCEPITDAATLFDPHAVKVVADHQGRALYFSRAPVPWHRGAFAAPNAADAPLPVGQWYRHIGIYAYRVGLLHQFVRWPPAWLERAESLEQLRALAHGAQIHIEAACAPVPAGVDTESDLIRVRAQLS